MKLLVTVQKHIEKHATQAHNQVSNLNPHKTALFILIIQIKQ
jgi:hypothetical protein